MSNLEDIYSLKNEPFNKIIVGSAVFNELVKLSDNHNMTLKAMVERLILDAAKLEDSKHE